MILQSRTSRVAQRQVSRDPLLHERVVLDVVGRRPQVGGRKHVPAGLYGNLLPRQDPLPRPTQHVLRHHMRAADGRPAGSVGCSIGSSGSGGWRGLNTCCAVGDDGLAKRVAFFVCCRGTDKLGIRTGSTVCSESHFGVHTCLFDASNRSKSVLPRLLCSLA